MKAEVMSPSEIHQQMFDRYVSLINESIVNKNWHNNFADSQELIDKYHAIILRPAHELLHDDKFTSSISDLFKAKGWDCKIGYCRDARGPHYCFYLSKSHFNQTENP